MFITRSSRVTEPVFKNTTSRNVGPGTYDVLRPEFEDLRYERPAFASRSDRGLLSFDLKERRKPAPGQYSPKNKGPLSRVNCRSRFKNKVPKNVWKSKTTQTEVPGPGTYSASLTSIKSFLFRKPVEYVKKTTMVPPSIPNTGTNFGYEVTEDDDLIRRIPPEPCKSEPGNYEISRSVSAPGYIEFWKSDTKRKTFTPRRSVTPGPGTYNRRKSQRITESMDQRPSTVFSSTVDRWKHYRGNGKPGPGHYKRDSPNKKQEINYQCFGSMQIRKSIGDVDKNRQTPGPGKYTSPSSIKETNTFGYGIETAFSSQASREMTKLQDNGLPGPGKYEDTNQIQLSKTFTVQDPNNHAPRFFKSAFDLTLGRPIEYKIKTPDPTHYQESEKEKRTFSSTQGENAFFKSQTERFVAPKDDYRPMTPIYTPKSPNDRKSTKVRRPTTSLKKTTPPFPGPGAYETQLHRSSRSPTSIFKSSCKRIHSGTHCVKGMSCKSPGPGTYNQELPAREKTFNVTSNCEHVSL